MRLLDNQDWPITIKIVNISCWPIKFSQTRDGPIRGNIIIISPPTVTNQILCHLELTNQAVTIQSILFMNDLFKYLKLTNQNVALKSILIHTNQSDSQISKTDWSDFHSHLISAAKEFVHYLFKNLPQNSSDVYLKLTANKSYLKLPSN
jgi:hypothetical protein